MALIQIATNVATCSHPCCTGKSPLDYKKMGVKDILVAGVADSEIR